MQDRKKKATVVKKRAARSAVLAPEPAPKAAADGEVCWISTADACKVFGLKGTTFAQVYKPRLEGKYVKRGKVFFYDGAAVRELWFQKYICARDNFEKIRGINPLLGRGINAAAVRQDVTDEQREWLLSLQANQSPQGNVLDIYRAEQTAILRLKRARLEGDQVSVGTLRRGLDAIAQRLRAMGETFTRNYGLQAGRLLNDALDSLEQDMEQILKDENRGS